MIKNKNDSSQLFRELATLINAGATPLASIKALVTSTEMNWIGVMQQLEQGSSFNKALFSNKIINRYEGELIEVAETAGRLGEGLNFIADSYEKRVTRIHKLKTKLIFPFIIIVFAIIVNIILTIAKDLDSNLINVFFNACFQLLITIIATKVLLSIMKKDACQVLTLPFVSQYSRWYRLLLQQVVVGGLLWQIKSGIDFKTGLLRISRLISSSSIRKSLQTASRFCSQGKSVYNSLTEAELPLNEDFKKILLVAEQSGNWNESIQRQLALENDQLNLIADSLFEWVPRFFYFVAVISTATVIFK